MKARTSVNSNYCSVDNSRSLTRLRRISLNCSVMSLKERLSRILGFGYLPGCEQAILSNNWHPWQISLWTNVEVAFRSYGIGVWLQAERYVLVRDWTSNKSVPKERSESSNDMYTCDSTHERSRLLSRNWLELPQTQTRSFQTGIHSRLSRFRDVDFYPLEIQENLETIENTSETKEDYK